MSKYKCDGCRRLFYGDEGKHGDACPNECGGVLRVIARFTRKMLAEHEGAV